MFICTSPALICIIGPLGWQASLITYFQSLAFLFPRRIFCILTRLLETKKRFFLFFLFITANQPQKTLENSENSQTLKKRLCTYHFWITRRFHDLFAIHLRSFAMLVASDGACDLIICISTYFFDDTCVSQEGLFFGSVHLGRATDDV